MEEQEIEQIEQGIEQIEQGIEQIEEQEIEQRGKILYGIFGMG